MGRQARHDARPCRAARKVFSGKNFTCTDEATSQVVLSFETTLKTFFRARQVGQVVISGKVTCPQAARFVPHPQQPPPAAGAQPWGWLAGAARGPARHPGSLAQLLRVGRPAQPAHVWGQLADPGRGRLGRLRAPLARRMFGHCVLLLPVKKCPGLAAVSARIDLLFPGHWQAGCSQLAWHPQLACRLHWRTLCAVLVNISVDCDTLLGQRKCCQVMRMWAGMWADRTPACTLHNCWAAQAAGGAQRDRQPQAVPWGCCATVVPYTPRLQVPDSTPWQDVLASGRMAVQPVHVQVVPPSALTEHS